MMSGGFFWCNRGEIFVIPPQMCQGKGEGWRGCRVGVIRGGKSKTCRGENQRAAGRSEVVLCLEKVSKEGHSSRKFFWEGCESEGTLG